MGAPVSGVAPLAGFSGELQQQVRGNFRFEGEWLGGVRSDLICMLLEEK